MYNTLYVGWLRNVVRMLSDSLCILSSRPQCCRRSRVVTGLSQTSWIDLGKCRWNCVRKRACFRNNFPRTDYSSLTPWQRRTITGPVDTSFRHPVKEILFLWRTQAWSAIDVIQIKFHTQWIALFRTMPLSNRSRDLDISSITFPISRPCGSLGTSLAARTVEHSVWLRKKRTPC